MLNKIVTVMLSAILCWTMFAGCTDNTFKIPPDGDTPQEQRISSDWTELPENANDNFKYFGYYHSDGFANGGEYTYFDQIEQLGNANVLFINSSYSTDKLSAYLADAESRGFKCMVSVFDIFFVSEAGAKDNKPLKGNYQTRWTELVTAIEPHMNAILGFYFDEPYWLSVKKDAFKAATQMIKTQFPSKKIMACTSAMEVGISSWGNVPIVPSDYYEFCTDLGYDYYEEWNDAQRLDFLNKFKDKAACNNQWIWAVPKAFETNPTLTQGNEITAHIKGFYTEAIQEPRYAGVAAFSFATGIDFDWGYGLESFFDETNEFYNEQLKNLYIDIGRAIISKEKNINAPVITLAVPDELNNSVLPYNSEVALPIATVTDDVDKNLTATVEVKNPNNEIVTPINNKITANIGGKYTLTYTARDSVKNKAIKTFTFCAKNYGEISSFESDLYLSDVAGSEDDLWAWPQSIDKDLTHNGSNGALKISTHATDGTWPSITFKNGSSEQFDMTQFDYISLYMYNPSNREIQFFGLQIYNAPYSNSAAAQPIITITAKMWIEARITKAEILKMQPTLDISKICIKFSQLGGTYDNRTEFYIDDVYFGKYTEVANVGDERVYMDFESAGQAESVSVYAKTDAGKLKINFARNSDGVVELMVSSFAVSGERKNEPKIFDIRDFTGYELKFDIFSDTQSSIGVRIDTADTAMANRIWNASETVYIKDTTTFAFDIGSDANAANLGRVIIVLVQNGNTDETNVFIDNIRLVKKA